MSKKIKLYFDWLNKNETGVIYSKLWSEMKDTFQDGVNRGYGINRTKEYKLLISIIISLSRFRNFINKILDKLFNMAFGLFSLLLTSDRKLYRKFGFHYAKDLQALMRQENQEFYDFYSRYSQVYGEYYSYSGMRVLYYYYSALEYLPSKPHRVLEIGAGMANFAIIHARHAEEFEYVIIDIPEIIPESYRNACSFLTDDIELYLPNEYELFLKSPARKKIIWLVPSQLELLENESFDFFCNTESFAEMPPYVAQNYWIEVERLLKIDSFAFLVNRVSRFTGESHDCYSEMSSPFKLQSNRLKPVSVSVDKFRSKIPKFTDRPNLVSVYKSLQDKC